MTADLKAMAQAPTSPDLSEKPLYPVLFYAAAFKSMFGSHRLKLNNLPHYTSTFHLSKARLSQWYDLFDVKPSKKTIVPFTYVNTSAAMVLLRIVEQLGINFKYLRHLKNEMYFLRPIPSADKVYTYTSEICDVMQLREDRVVLVMDTTVYDRRGNRICLQRDYWIILEVPAKDIAQIISVNGVYGPDMAQFQGLSKRNPMLKSWLSTTKIKVPEDMAVRYGKVSGDLNPLHTNALLARMFGVNKPFLQGYCAVNYAIKHMMQSSAASLTELSTTFVRPIFVGQTIELRHNHEAFEMHDDKGKLLVSGTWKTKPSGKTQYPQPAYSSSRNQTLM